MLMMLSACGSDLKYDMSLDAHELYGDGEFQLEKVGSPVRYELYDWKYEKTVLGDVQNYRNEGKLVFFDGCCPIYIARESRMVVVLDPDANMIAVIYDRSVLSEETALKLENYFVNGMKEILLEFTDADTYPGGFEGFIDHYRNQ